MRDVESFALYRRVRVERHVQSIAGRYDRVWQTAATQSTQLTSARVIAVKDLQTVIRALHVCFQLEVVERLQHVDIITPTLCFQKIHVTTSSTIT